jgi:polynucleotide 5'-kinase involved in rRNA processing
MLIHLLGNEKVLITGAAVIKVIEGACSILGYYLDEKADPISFIVSPFDSCHLIQSTGLKKLNDSDENIEKCSIQITPLDSHINFLKDYELGDFVCVQETFAVYLQSKKFQLDDSDSIRSDSKSTNCKAILRPNLLFPEWQNAVKDIVENLQVTTPSVVVSGGKGSGKSTFLRYVINAMVSNRRDANLPVALLDCDTGQPELFTPGCVSLTLCSKGFLSSPYYSSSTFVNMKSKPTNRLRVISQLFLGSVSPKSHPRAYLDAYSYLVGLYIHEYLPKGIPLVVNTHGWIRGIGFQTIQRLVEALSPTHLVQLESLEQSSDLSPFPDSSSEMMLSPNPFLDGSEMNGFGNDDQPTPNPVNSRRRKPAMEVITCPFLSNQPGVPSKTFTLPPWFQHHASTLASEGVLPPSLEEEGGSAESGAGAAGAVPPRAARSPVDLRALRWLLYFSQSPHLPHPLHQSLVEGSSNGSGGLPDLSDTEALSLFSSHLQLAFQESAQRARSEQKEARAPSEGLLSPAFSLSYRQSELVRLSSGVRVFATPEEAIEGELIFTANPDRAIESFESRIKTAKSFLGSVVGVCSREMDHPLTCLGIGIVRAIDQVSGTLELVTPLKVSELSVGSFILVGWDSQAGPADLPPQLLYRNASLGDPFCLLPSMLASTSVVSAKASNNRKNLKRHRFDPKK